MSEAGQAMRAVASGLSVLLGTLLLIITYVFGSMIGSTPGPSEWRSVLLRKMFLQGGVAEGTYLGVGLVLGGLVLLLSACIGDRTEGGRPVTRTLFGLAIAISLLALIMSRFVGLF